MSVQHGKLHKEPRPKDKVFCGFGWQDDKNSGGWMVQDSVLEKGGIWNGLKEIT